MKRKLYKTAFQVGQSVNDEDADTDFCQLFNNNLPKWWIFYILVFWKTKAAITTDEIYEQSSTLVAISWLNPQQFYGNCRVVFTVPVVREANIQFSSTNRAMLPAALWIDTLYPLLRVITGIDKHNNYSLSIIVMFAPFRRKSPSSRKKVNTCCRLGYMIGTEQYRELQIATSIFWQMTGEKLLLLREGKERSSAVELNTPVRVT